MMMPCMTGVAGLRSMKRGMDSSNKIVRNNLLKKIRRHYPSKKAKKLQLKTNKEIRNKAYNLSRKVNTASLPWTYFFWIFIVSWYFIAFFCNYWIYILGNLLIFVVIKVIFDAFALGVYTKTVIPKKMRKAKISPAKITGSAGVS